jgi:hypothetical protein
MYLILHAVCAIDLFPHPALHMKYTSCFISSPSTMITNSAFAKKNSDLPHAPHPYALFGGKIEIGPCLRLLSSAYGQDTCWTLIRGQFDRNPREWKRTQMYHGKVHRAQRTWTAREGTWASITHLSLLPNPTLLRRVEREESKTNKDKSSRSSPFLPAALSVDAPLRSDLGVQFPLPLGRGSKSVEMKQVLHQKSDRRSPPDLPYWYTQ